MQNDEDDDKNIASIFLQCLECETEWRSHETNICPVCHHTNGTPTLLTNKEINDFMQAICFIPEYEDEEDINEDIEVGIIHYDIYYILNEKCNWLYKDEYDLPKKLQACWLHLNQYVIHERRIEITILFLITEFKYAIQNLQNLIVIEDIDEDD